MESIQMLKDTIGPRAEKIIADAYGMKKIGAKYRCPETQNHKNADHDPSMSWHADALQFYCHRCQKKIDIYTYYTEKKGLTHKDAMSELVVRPIKEFKNTKKASPLGVNQREYLHARGLTDETIKRFRFGSIDGGIAIPFYRHGKLTGVKIRKIDPNAKPKYYSIEGSDFGLYNMSEPNGKTLIITEGEIDCVSVCQCGYHNTVAVGKGVKSINQAIRDYDDYLNAYKNIIVLRDNDLPGAEILPPLKEAYKSKIKTPDMALYMDCGDINEVLQKHGEEQVKKIIESATAKIEGLRDLTIDPYEGIEVAEGRYIPTGMPLLDGAINDLMPGLVTLVTGRSNGGKTTFVTQVCANAVDHGHRVFWVAGEGLQTLAINALYKAVIGKDKEHYDYRTVNKRKFKEPKPEVLKALRKWHKEKLYFFNKGQSDLKTTDQLFAMMETTIDEKQPHLIVIDNLMSVLSVEKASEKLDRQADFMQRCCDLAKNAKIHIILVLHPNKTLMKDGDMDFEQISGTMDLANKADNIIVVKRHYEPKDAYITGEIALLKNRYFPDLLKIRTHYEVETGLLLEVDDQRLLSHYPFRWKEYLNKQAEITEDGMPW